MSDDERYAAWLQQQEMLSMATSDAKIAAEIQFRMNRQDDYEDVALAMSLQDQQYEETTEAAIGGFLHEDQADSFLRLSEQMAVNIHRDEVAMVTKQDQHLAQQIMQKYDASGDETAAETLYHDEMSAMLKDDEALARDIQDRQMCYREQMSADEELARRLMEEEERTHRHRGAPCSQSGTEADFLRSLSEYSQHQPGPVRRRNSSRQPRGLQRHGAHNHAADDIPDDYESLLDLAEQIGNAGNPGLREDQISALPTQTYTSQAARSSTPPDDTGPPDDDDSSPQGPSSQDGACAAPANPANDEDTQCKVCYEDFAAGDTLRTLPCLHKYHKDCIDRWIKTKAICPVCKLELKDEINRATEPS